MDAQAAQLGSPLKSALATVRRLFDLPRVAQPSIEGMTQQQDGQGELGIGLIGGERDDSSSVSSLPNFIRDASTTHSTSLKRPAADIDAIPNEDEAERHAHGPRKRVKRNVRAENVILAPRRSQRNLPVTSMPRSDIEDNSRQAKRVATPESDAPSTMDDPQKTSSNPVKPKRGRPRKIDSSPGDPALKSASGSANSIKAVNGPSTPTQPTKRRRGRPRKSSVSGQATLLRGAVSQQPLVTDNLLVSIEKDEVAGVNMSAEEDRSSKDIDRPSMIEELPRFAPEALVRNEDGDGGNDHEGISDILLEPSPIKEKRSSNSLDPTNINQNYSDTIQENLTGPPLQRDTSDDYEAQNNEAEVELELEDDEAGKASIEPVFGYDLLEQMVILVHRVGHRRHPTSEEFVLKRTEEMITTSGKKIIRPIDRLISTYGILRNEKDPDKQAEARELVASLIPEIQLRTKSIMTTRLKFSSSGIDNEGKGKVGHKTKMLQDLYFNIIPPLVDAIHMASDIYPPDQYIDTFALQQLSDLVSSLEQLATAATMQPKEHQPQPHGNSKASTYQIQRPTRMILPIVRQIQKGLIAESVRRNDIKSTAERQRDHEERRSAEESRQRRRQEESIALFQKIKKSQAEAFSEKLKEPIWGELLARKIAAQAAKGRQISQSIPPVDSENRKPSIEYAQNSQDFQDGDGHVVDDGKAAYDRISVFGRNNTNAKSRPLSNEEKNIFVECMRNERGLSHIG